MIYLVKEETLSYYFIYLVRRKAKIKRNVAAVNVSFGAVNLKYLYHTTSTKLKIKLISDGGTSAADQAG
jgi:hypothetical protein